MHVEFSIPDSHYQGCLVSRCQEALESLRRPLNVKGQITKPAVALLLGQDAGPIFWVSVSIEEGKHHQIRRLCKRAGLRVLRLVRVSFGPLELGGLPAGSARALTVVEVRACYDAAGMAHVASLHCPAPVLEANLVSAFLRDIGRRPTSEAPGGAPPLAAPGPSPQLCSFVSST